MKKRFLYLRSHLKTQKNNKNIKEKASVFSLFFAVVHCTNGYVLADRSLLSKINDIVLSLGTGTGSVKILESGYYFISGLTAGSPVYLGTSGNMTCSKPDSAYR